MATNNSQNSEYANNADGAQIAGGTVKRILKWLGANITITGSGSNTYSFPASSDTLLGRDSTDTVTNKTIDGDNNTLQDIASSALKQAFFKGRYQSDNSNSIASSDQSGLTVQFGWAQIIGDGTGTLNDSITFPTAFSSVLFYHLSPLGQKSTAGAAADITGFNAAGLGTGNVFSVSGIVSTTGITAALRSQGNNFTNSRYHGWSWIAIGTI